MSAALWLIGFALVLAALSLVDSALQRRRIWRAGLRRRW